MLTLEERQQLQTFDERYPPGTPYLRRVQILLMADAGVAHEEISATIGIPIVQTRNLLRAFNRQRLALFPAEIFREPPLFQPDEPLVEAGRKIFAAELERFQSLAATLADGVEVTTVHELRKTVRRLDTAFQLFAPYFTAEALDGPRRGFLKIMRRLGPARDTAVFLAKLEMFGQENALPADEREALAELESYWRARLDEYDQALAEYLARPKVQEWLAGFGQLVTREGEAVAKPVGELRPTRVRHLLPSLIYAEVADVRAYEGQLAGASIQDLHRLRLRAKELRYTLTFFEGVLGPCAGEVIEGVKRLQEHLGEINDARVALAMLEETPELERAVALYRPAKEAELAQLINDLAGPWNGLIGGGWRQGLASAIAAL
jgi:CHAD domain-containing protein